MSAPLSRQTAPKASTQRCAASSRWAATQLLSSPSSRASSPACGVSTVGAERWTGSSPKSAVRVDDDRELEPLQQGPDERARFATAAEPRADRNRARPGGRIDDRAAASSPPQAIFTGSTASVSTTGRDALGTASVTYPASARSAAVAESTAAGQARRAADDEHRAR